MKSVDPGILNKSECFSFQPSEIAAKTMKYLTWCGHYFCTSSYFMERETYPYVLLIFVRDGNMDVRYNGKNYLIGKGDVLLIDCVNPHYYRAHDGLEFLYVHFDGTCSHELTELIIRNNNSPVFRRSHNLKVGQEIFKCVQFFSKGGIANIFQESFHIERLLYWLSCDTEEKVAEVSPMEKIITHIHENFTRKLTVDELASIANVSPSHLAHTFKKQTGYAPVEYVLKMRIERAMMLLTHSNKTVAEIAEEVGYDSTTAFIKIFKRKTNYSPSAYRRLQKSSATR